MSSIRIRTAPAGEYTELRLLINHPMENGRNRDPLTGALIPAHFITELSIMLNKIIILSVEMGGSMSKNPFFNFRLKNLRSGDEITVNWIDNQQFSDSADYKIE